MTVTWERFAGRTDRFAIRVSLLADPDDGAGARPEDAASWGSVQLWAQNRNLCAHVDQGEALSAVHWYLLPLAEWLAENWNALLHEERLPVANSADTGVVSLDLHRVPSPVLGEQVAAAREQEWFDWRSRHALRSARAGGLFPNVVFRRLRDYVEVSWDSASEVGAPDGFDFGVGQGSALLEPRDVAGPLHDVLTALAQALNSESGVAPRVTDLGTRLARLASTAQDEARSTWMVGGDSASSVGPGDGLWSRVRATLAANGSRAAVEAALQTDDSALVVERACPAALLFASVSPDVVADDVRTLSSVLLDQYAPVAESRLDGLVEDAPVDERRRAWEQGYDLAEALHDDHEIDVSHGWVDVEGFLRDLDVRIVERSLTDRDIAACSIVGPRHLPTVVVNPRYPGAANPAGRRFTLAHELCHLLYDHAEGARLAIASGPWAPRAIEQRARAFAAMFLLPPRVIETALARVERPITTVEGITDLAGSVRVSRVVAVRHLSNMALLSESERDDLLRRLQDR